MTLTELQALSPDELRVLVAKLRGWEKRGEHWYKEGELPRCSNHFHYKPLPDYPDFLDSCREFEDAMTDEEHKSFRDNLWKITAPDQSCPWSIDPAHNRAYISATPPQKCQAYILAMATKTEGAE